MAQIAPAIFLDDSMPHLSSEMITEAFLTVSPKEASAYLAHYSWGGEILGKMNPRLRANIEGQHVVEAQSPALIQGARRKIAEFIRDKDRQGVINLRQINAKVIGDAKTGS